MLDQRGQLLRAALGSLDAPCESVLQELTHMVVDFVCGVLGLRPPERYEQAVWVVLLIVLVILFALALMLTP